MRLAYLGSCTFESDGGKAGIGGDSTLCGFWGMVIAEEGKLVAERAL